jgi:hypothetical protein
VTTLIQSVTEGNWRSEKENIPAKYRPLLDWYSEKFVGKRKDSKETDPILGLRGLGKEIWVGETPDDYVNRVRGGWE